MISIVFHFILPEPSLLLLACLVFVVIRFVLYNKALLVEGADEYDFPCFHGRHGCIERQELDKTKELLSDD